MVHYNVWFSFKDDVEETCGLTALEEFLRELCLLGDVTTFRLLKNSSEPARSKLPRFQAIIEFSDDAALSRAMKNQRERGIHTGSHGRIVDVVSEFRVEIFRVVRAPVFALQYACEI